MIQIVIAVVVLLSWKISPVYLQETETEQSLPKLLADRSWFSQVARVHPHHQPPLRVDDKRRCTTCVAVAETLAVGMNVEGYELVERTALLGVCNHRQRQEQQRRESYDRPSLPTRDGHTSTTAVDPHAHKEEEERDEGIKLLPTTSILPTTTVYDKESEHNQLVCPAAVLPTGPTLEYQCLLEEIDIIYINANYRLKKKFDAGSHGEVWKATRRTASSSTSASLASGAEDEQFVLKRLFLDRGGDEMVEMGLREAHFGAKLRDRPHVTRFVEYFFRPLSTDEADDHDHDSTSEEEAEEAAEEGDSPPPPLRELWLVFHDEGISLRQYLYAKRTSSHAGSVVFEPSHFWEKLRADTHGELVLREIMRQILQSVAALHSMGITHRDIKPSNILINIQSSSSSNKGNLNMIKVPIVKLADFGSAVDDYTLRHLYTRTASGGPSQAEETREYQPPEVLFHAGGQPYDYAVPFSYDLWSVGVVFLEMVLGSPQVFIISPRARAKLDADLRGKDEQTKRKSYLLHVLTHEFCIFQPPHHQLHALWNKYALVTDGCHFGKFNTTIVQRDPLRKGLENSWGLDLIWRLLQWHPDQRIQAKDALEHAFFHGPYICKQSGREFAIKQELAMHEAYLAVQQQREHEMGFVVREKYDLPQVFECPHCHRQFTTIASCEQHLMARKHNRAAHTYFCGFNGTSLIRAIEKETEKNELLQSSPIEEVTLDPAQVGRALFQGRKKYMEDFLVVANNPALGFDLYAIADGHLGSGAASYVVQNLYQVLSQHFAAIASMQTTPQHEREFAERVALRQTFMELHDGFLNSSSNQSARENDRFGNHFQNRSEMTDFSGCTLTVVIHFPHQNRLISANVGDSRAIAILFTEKEEDDDAAATIIPLSMDHWPNVDVERSRIESSGGFVSFEGLWRVVGQLAVSRSIGDQHLRQYVTTEPSVFYHTLPGSTKKGNFVVVASDGLWETMTNQDVVRFLHDKQQQHANSNENDANLDVLARELIVESYVRGSLDNLAVLLIAV